MEVTNKKAILLLLFLIIQLTVVYMSSQTNFTVRLQDGTEQSYVLATLRKITFENQNLVLNTLDEGKIPFIISSIDKMFFEDSNSATTDIQKNIEENSSVSIYPNPATDYIYVRNLPGENNEIMVFNMHGVLVLRKILPYFDAVIDISGLPKGFYFLKVNDNTFKFGKL